MHNTRHEKRQFRIMNEGNNTRNLLIKTKSPILWYSNIMRNIKIRTVLKTFALLSFQNKWNLEFQDQALLVQMYTKYLLLFFKLTLWCALHPMQYFWITVVSPSLLLFSPCQSNWISSVPLRNRHWVLSLQKVIAPSALQMPLLRAQRKQKKPSPIKSH